MENIDILLYSADHEQDWQPYPVDPYFCYMCDHTLRIRQLVDTKLLYFVQVVHDSS